MERSSADSFRQTWWRTAASMAGRFGWWVWGPLGLGVIVLGSLVTGALDMLPSRDRIACLVSEWRHEPAPGTKFTVLISTLAYDKDGRQTKLVRNVFLGERGIDTRRTCRVVPLDAVGGSGANAEARAIRTGRALLEDWNADLLIWGYVKKANEELILWFLSKGGANTIGLSSSCSLTKNSPCPRILKPILAP